MNWFERWILRRIVKRLFREKWPCDNESHMTEHMLVLLNGHMENYREDNKHTAGCVIKEALQRAVENL